MDIKLTLRARRYAPSFRYEPGQVAALDRWLDTISDAAPNAIEAVTLHGVLSISKGRHEAHEVFMSRVRAFIAEAIDLR